LHSCRFESAHDLTGIASGLPDLYPYLLDSAASGLISGPGTGDDFLSRLDSWFQQQKKPQNDKSGWPFIGGWFVYLGYELAAEIEPVVNFPPANDGFPVAFASRCPAVIYSVADQPGVLHLVAETESLLQQMRNELMGLKVSAIESPIKLEDISVDQPERFKQALAKIHEYILDGDVFQVNLSRGWQGRFDHNVEPACLYRSLRKSNPAPFAGMISWDDFVLMSSSPERLVHINQGEIQSRPIAGTRPRGRDSEADQALTRELLEHPKERAEHIMLIDLERNDLGRVCETGSVEVDELMVVESYEHVHHIVSNVRGKLRSDVTPVDVIRAVFPGGTITGCPKVRCMEIIAELEPHGRSFYTGSFGYLGLDGSMDLNILIRSMLLHQNQISFRTGAGIVADSIADAEVRETEDKARGLLRALGVVQSDNP
jgi:anthranilate synthase component 1